MNIDQKIIIFPKSDIYNYCYKYIFSRLQTFLELPEYEHSENTSSDYSVGTVHINNASMAWEILTQKSSIEDDDKGKDIAKSNYLQSIYLNYIHTSISTSKYS